MCRQRLDGVRSVVGPFFPFADESLTLEAVGLRLRSVYAKIHHVHGDQTPLDLVFLASMFSPSSSRYLAVVVM